MLAAVRSALGVKDFGVCILTLWGMVNPIQTHPQSLLWTLPAGRLPWERVTSQLCGSPASIRASYVDEMTLPSRDQRSNMSWRCSEPGLVVRA